MKRRTIPEILHDLAAALARTAPQRGDACGALWAELAAATDPSVRISDDDDDDDDAPPGPPVVRPT